MNEDGSVSDWVASLSVEQKAALCLGSDFWHTAPVESAGIESIMVSDGPHGLRKQPGRGEQVGISGSVPATCFPTASALGSSWDPGLAREVGVAIGLEARGQNIAVVLGPGINIKRSPLCGRNFEYLSEDPYLSGRLAAAIVEGLQSQQVGASLKHFAANNQETDRVRISADVDERTLREIYLPAFEHVVVTARPWTVMCSYNKINGEYASQDRWLLTTLLREEWGFDGVVVSDWGAVHDRVAALAAGLDLEMPPDLGVSDRAIINAVAGGSFDEALLDQAVARILRLVQRSRRRESAAIDIGTQHALARRAAGMSMVLLKNTGGVLPLQDRPGLTVAVVGEFARTPRFQGAGSSQVSPTRVDIPLEELAAALPAAAVRYAAGFRIGDSTADAELAAAAVTSAGGADVIIAFLGLPPADESEGFDRTHIDLPAAQTDLLGRLGAAHPDIPIVVVLFNGSVVRTSTWDNTAAAIVECWLAGQAAGSALADVLTGAVNPSGRLTETIPVRLQDTPSYLNFPGEQGHVRYGEGIFVGYRGFDAVDLPVAYPFGHGLSYSAFRYSALQVSHVGSRDGGDLAVTVSCSVTNVSDRPGSEVVQLYVGAPDASVARPPRELRGFRKLKLADGETRQATFTLTGRDLSYWSPARREWTLEPGHFELAVGASSRDLRLTGAITVSGTSPRTQLTGMSTLQEWLDDPDGGPALRREIGTGPDGQPAGILGHDELIKIIGNFTLHTLAVFPGLGITHAVLENLMPPPPEPGEMTAHCSGQRAFRAPLDQFLQHEADR
jgi:beta-glucosidase